MAIQICFFGGRFLLIVSLLTKLLKKRNEINVCIACNQAIWIIPLKEKLVLVCKPYCP